jgi:hypothetical protein
MTQTAGCTRACPGSGSSIDVVRNGNRSMSEIPVFNVARMQDVRLDR